MKIHETARIAQGAVVYGDVSVGEKTSIWYNAVVRGDSDSITIGKYSNVQDNCTVHVDVGHPLTIGDYVTIGHSAVVHGCHIGDRCLIGMGAIILNDAVIEEDCIIGAGALISQGKVIPKGSLVVGNPGKIIRSVTEEDKQSVMKNALHYAKMPFGI
ncbi:MAG: gamma carbonic anhydrase family protein [Lachnospiraceae bacterium]|nr:gamma carbonic anhydrase family protein [Lachnospiraceae bacterium]